MHGGSGRVRVGGGAPLAPQDPWRDARPFDDRTGYAAHADGMFGGARGGAGDRDNDGAMDRPSTAEALRQEHAELVSIVVYGYNAPLWMLRHGFCLAGLASGATFDLCLSRTFHFETVPSFAPYQERMDQELAQMREQRRTGAGNGGFGGVPPPERQRKVVAAQGPWGDTQHDRDRGDCGAGMGGEKLAGGGMGATLEGDAVAAEMANIQKVDQPPPSLPPPALHSHTNSEASRALVGCVLCCAWCFRCSPRAAALLGGLAVSSSWHATVWACEWASAARCAVPTLICYYLPSLRSARSRRCQNLEQRKWLLKGKVGGSQGEDVEEAEPALDFAEILRSDAVQVSHLLLVTSEDGCRR